MEHDKQSGSILTIPLSFGNTYFNFYADFDIYKPSSFEGISSGYLFK